MLTAQKLRLLAFALAVLLAVPVLLAAQLQPAPTGIGTHQQLGLPPCSVRLLLNVRCPACGMTTAWAHFMNGHWQQSAQANLGGFLLAGLDLLTIALCLGVLRSGSPPSRRLWRPWGWAVLVIAAITSLQWGWRLL